MRVHKRRLRGGFAGFGDENIAVDDQGNVLVTGQTGQTAAAWRTQLTSKQLFNVSTADAAASAEVLGLSQSGRQQGQNIVINATPESIPPSDPRHPQHKEWLADMVVANRRAKAKARMPWIIGGGGLVAALLVVVVVLRKRKAATT